MKHLIESQQYNDGVLDELVRRANRFRANPQGTSLRNKVVAMLFYEESLRTRNCLESAALRAGAKGVLNTTNAGHLSSIIERNSLEDTIRIIGGFSDAIVLRHTEKGAAYRASKVSTVPIINAGDGDGQHPVQALADIYTIKRELGRLHNLKVALVGDLASGRTARSVMYRLARSKNNVLYLISPPGCKAKDDIKLYLGRHNVDFREGTDLEAVLPDVDVIYMTGIPNEKKEPGNYSINERNLRMISKHARILHPMPRNEEIQLSPETERKDRRVAYFRGAKNGLYTGMAIFDYFV